MSNPELGLIHHFIPARSPDAATLLLLHGTGGNENSLLDLGRMLSPRAALLSPRGPVLEHGMPRFFRRLAEGIFDVDDLIQRTQDLGDFVGQAAAVYGFDPGRVVAAGFSNGANIAASLLLLRPGTLAGAILLAPQVPLEPDPSLNLAAVPVLIGAGRHDPLVPVENTERLARILLDAGAAVTLHWHPGGHALTQDEVQAAADWLGQSFPEHV
ncbi:MAG: alpha/beta hydrolase [Armatimonadetes bacterium]|nr:alpha/beta hydrolase [Armatimonadota bacterium]